MSVQPQAQSVKPYGEHASTRPFRPRIGHVPARVEDPLGKTVLPVFRTGGSREAIEGDLRWAPRARRRGGCATHAVGEGRHHDAPDTIAGPGSDRSCTALPGPAGAGAAAAAARSRPARSGHPGLAPKLGPDTIEHPGRPPGCSISSASCPARSSASARGRTGRLLGTCAACAAPRSRSFAAPSRERLGPQSPTRCRSIL